MYRSSGASDRNIRDVASENSELKRFHEQMKREVRTILGRHEGILGRAVLEDSSGVNKRGSGRGRPTRVADAGFTGSLKKQWNSLKQLVEILEARAAQSEVTHVISVTDHEKELTRLQKEVQDLREELAQSKELICQQQQLLQDQNLPPPGEGLQSPLWDAYFLEEQLRLQEERAVFEEHKLAFQDEREKFTEAAIRLGRERVQFKADQALFMKQQFLNLTPGVPTPPWKKTPPWSALSAGTPTRSPSTSKRQFTPSMSCGGKFGLTSADPMTPSTAELYRVLRLAPPNRSVMSHQCHSGSQQSSESEEGSSDQWSDSLSPSSASPELQPLPHSVAPFKLSMTPYLRPKPTPMSAPRSHADPRTPSSAELFRVLRLTPAESAHSGRKRRGDTLWKSVVHHSHRRASLSKMTEPPCCQETAKYNESVSRCPHEVTGDGYETDSLHSDDMGHAVDQGDTPTSETHSLPREDSECFDNDSLYRVTPLQEISLHHLRGHIHHPGDPDFYNQLACFHSKCGWPCEEFGDQRSSNGIHSNIQKGNPKETLQPTDRCRSQSRETLHPRDACRSRSAENRQSGNECRSRSRERTHSRERCRTQSKKYPERRHTLCHLPRPIIHFEEECQNRDSHPSSTKRRKSLESVHHKQGHSRDAPYVTGTCSSRSMRRRSSQNHRDSLYTSGPGRSPLHLRQSCPSTRNTAPWTSEQVAANNLCADLMMKFMDCSF